jgi:hypothetical protein
MDFRIVSYRNQSWDDSPDLFGIKIARDLASAFLKRATLSVSPPDFLNCGSGKNHAIGVILFIIFNVFTL